MMLKPLIAGNWKMHCLRAEGEALATAIRKKADTNSAEVLLCPPTTLLQAIAQTLKGSAIALGAQDCHPEAQGAFTGNISAPMIKDAGGTHVIVGHSERRQQHAETSALVAKKADAAHKAGLIALICIGETGKEREDGNTLKVIESQLRESIPSGANALNTVIAYEPVWAIGTGKVARGQDIAEAHDFIAHILSAMPAFKTSPCRILYGGSVKADNASTILKTKNVGGVLVGGASLNADEFLKIIEGAA